MRSTELSRDDMAKRRIISFHWNNVDSRVVRGQSDVFHHFGLSIEQHRRDRLNHGVFLDEIIRDLEQDTTLLIVDIDCVPLNPEIVERAFTFAEAGGIIGCAQVASHIDWMRIYAAPMFFAISQKTWEELGRPSFHKSPTGDVAQDLHDIAAKMDRRIEHLHPTACLIPKWRLADRGCYGIGTFYQGGVFHLFELRSAKYNALFVKICDDIVHDRQPNFLDLSHQAMMRYPFNVAQERLRKARKIKINQRSAQALLGRLLGRPTTSQT